MKFRDDVETMSRSELITYINNLEHRLMPFLAEGDVPLSNLQTKLKMTLSQARCAALLVDGSIRTVDQLHAASNRYDKETDAVTIVRVHLANVRKKTAHLGVKIQNIYGGRYEMTAGNDALRALMAEAA